MTFLIRIFFSVAMMGMIAAADISSCRTMTQGATQCNPYSTSFLKITQLKKGVAALRRRPVTEKKALTVEKIRVKNGMTLHNLISKYIKREERLYYKAESEKLQKLDSTKTAGEPRKQPQKEETEEPATVPVPELPSKIVVERQQEKPKAAPEESVAKPIPTELPKTVVLTPGIKPSPLPPEAAEDNLSTATQPPAEVILPAELLPEKQEKQADINQRLKAEYAVYVVKKGDSLIGIAKRFGVKTEVLIEINRLGREPMLREGQKLRIPISQEDLDAIDNAVYIVKRGDTLSKIAKHFQVKVSDLKKYNKIRKKSVIHVGQVLILPLPKKLLELKRIEEQKRKAALKKKRERERLARIALKKAERARFLKASKGLKRKLSVTATAYTSHRSQTDSTPFLAAWNNRIRPGMKIIAVSHDLIRRYGITNGKKVRISGLPGIYTVRDKMNKRWRRKIDIYMGTSRWRALRWGRRRVTLYY